MTAGASITFCAMADDTGGTTSTRGGGLLACLSGGLGVMDLEDCMRVGDLRGVTDLGLSGEVTEICLVTLDCLRRCTGDEARRSTEPLRTGDKALTLLI